MNAPRQSKILVVAHDRPTTIDGSDATYVALTPEAFEAITTAGLTPLALDDLAVRPSFFVESVDYYRWKYAWFGRIDAAARGGDGIVLAAAQLLNTPLDSVVAGAALLRSAVEQAAPTSLRYVGPSQHATAPIWHAGHLQFHSLLGDPPLAASLAPLVALAVDIPYEAEHRAPAAPPPSAPLQKRLRDALATQLGPLRGQRPSRRPDRHRGTLMLWRSGYGATTFAARERTDRRAVYYLSRGGTTTRVFEPDRLSLEIVSRSVAVAPRPWSTTLDPAVTALLAEVDEWAGVPGAGRILESRLAAFVNGVCPAIDEAASALDPILRRREIDRVAAANPSSIEELAALEWARRCSIERVLCQHGDHLFSYDAWVMTETQNFDVLSTSDTTLEDEIPRLARLYDIAVPRVETGSARIAELRAPRGEMPDRNVPDRDVVAYVPAMLVGDSYIFGGGYLNDVWYHRWHRRLLEHMAARPDTTFWWKALPIGDQARDPMPDLIASVTNVEYRSDPFLNVAAAVGRVVTDFASTALYECVTLGIPVLAINFSEFATLRPAAADAFAPLVVECADESQALSAIEHFLDDDPNHWLLDRDRVARLTGCA